MRANSIHIVSDLIQRRAVLGHKSVLAFGLMGPGDGVPVVAMLGRVSHLQLPAQRMAP